MAIFRWFATIWLSETAQCNVDIVVGYRIGCVPMAIARKWYDIIYVVAVLKCSLWLIFHSNCTNYMSVYAVCVMCASRDANGPHYCMNIISSTVIFLRHSRQIAHREQSRETEAMEPDNQQTVVMISCAFVFIVCPMHSLRNAVANGSD